MKKMIVGNLKMNMENVSQRDAYCKEMCEVFSGIHTTHTLILCPPVIYTEYFCRAFHNTSFAIGTQDCFWEMYGSYTGNTSPKAIHSLGGTHVILGHSERRTHNHESNEDIVRKTKTAIRSELVPIVCVGFLSHDDEMHSVHEQVGALLAGLSREEMEKVVIAYEPVWAIGSGKTPTSDEIHTMVMYIRSMIVQEHGKDISAGIPILYGGSVTAENIDETCMQSYADGVLVGTTSLSPEKFAAMVRGIS